MPDKVIDKKEGDEDHEPEMVVIDETDPASVKAGEQYKAQLAALNTADDDEDDEDGADKDTRMGKGRQSDEDEGRQVRADETDEQRKERRRQWKKDKKRRVAEARHRDQVERNYLEQMNDRLEKQVADLRRRQSTSEAMVLETNIGQLESQSAEADRLLAEAVEANAGADVARITNLKTKIDGRLTQLRAVRDGITQRQQQGQEEEAAAPRRINPPPAVAAQARAFQTRNPWIDPQMRDRDSQMVVAIDKVLSLDSRFDATTPKYWKELEKRLKEALPHRFADDADDDDFDDPDDEQDEPTPRRGNGERRQAGGPRMPGGNDGGGGRKEVFHLSRERKEAMQELGVWDDPKLRAKYIKKYREYDKANPAPSR